MPLLVVSLADKSTSTIALDSGVFDDKCDLTAAILDEIRNVDSQRPYCGITLAPGAGKNSHEAALLTSSALRNIIEASSMRQGRRGGAVVDLVAVVERPCEEKKISQSAAPIDLQRETSNQKAKKAVTLPGATQDTVVASAAPTSSTALTATSTKNGSNVPLLTTSSGGSDRGGATQTMVPINGKTAKQLHDAFLSMETDFPLTAVGSPKKERNEPPAVAASSISSSSSSNFRKKAVAAAREPPKSDAAFTDPAPPQQCPPAAAQATNAAVRCVVAAPPTSPQQPLMNATAAKTAATPSSALAPYVIVSDVATAAGAGWSSHQQPSAVAIAQLRILALQLAEERFPDRMASLTAHVREADQNGPTRFVSVALFACEKGCPPVEPPGGSDATSVPPDWVPAGTALITSVTDLRRLDGKTAWEIGAVVGLAALQPPAALRTAAVLDFDAVQRVKGPPAPVARVAVPALSDEASRTQREDATARSDKASCTQNEEAKLPPAVPLVSKVATFPPDTHLFDAACQTTPRAAAPSSTGSPTFGGDVGGEGPGGRPPSTSHAEIAAERGGGAFLSPIRRRIVTPQVPSQVRLSLLVVDATSGAANVARLAIPAFDEDGSGLASSTAYGVSFDALLDWILPLILPDDKLFTGHAIVSCVSPSYESQHEAGRSRRQRMKALVLANAERQRYLLRHRVDRCVLSFESTMTALHDDNGHTVVGPNSRTSQRTQQYRDAEGAYDFAAPTLSSPPSDNPTSARRTLQFSDDQDVVVRGTLAKFHVGRASSSQPYGAATSQPPPQAPLLKAGPSGYASLRGILDDVGVDRMIGEALERQHGGEESLLQIFVDLRRTAVNV